LPVGVKNMPPLGLENDSAALNRVNILAHLIERIRRSGYLRMYVIILFIKLLKMRLDFKTLYDCV